MGWQIRGDDDVTVTTAAGVTYGLDGTLRDFDDMNFSNWSLKFQAQGDDIFTYTIRTKNAKGLGAIVPRDGQVIRIYVDGDRVFKGHVVKPRLGLNSLTVTAYGPWWWMGKITLSGAVADSTGVTADRASYVLPTQGLRTSMRAIINRAEYMGVPMARITDANESARIDSMYVMLKTTLSNMSFAAALSELLACIPDAVPWFDYSVEPPAMYISRRDAMTAISYAVGASGTTRVEAAEIQPRTDQRVQRVELKHVKRQPTTGKPMWASQDYGTLSTATHNRQVQIITISGPETVQIMPKDDFDTVKIRTQARQYASTYFLLDPVLKDAQEKYGGLTGNFPYIQDAGWYRIISGETAEWMRKDYGLKTRTRKVAMWVEGTYLSSTGLGGATAYLKSIGKLTTFPTNDPVTTGFRLFVDFSMEQINLSYPNLTTVYKKWDYDYLAPPAGLAQNLRDAQNWTPWEGPVTLVRPDLTGYNGLRRKFNLTNSHPDHAGMDALVRSVTYSSNRRVTWELGPPARADLGGLVNRARRNPQDNIVFL